MTSAKYNLTTHNYTCIKSGLKPFDSPRERRERIPQANAGALDLEGKRNKGNTMEPLHGDTFIQVTPPLWGHKIWSQKNVHITFVSVTSSEGSPLFRGKGHFFMVPERNFNLHSGDTSAQEK